MSTDNFDLPDLAPLDRQLAYTPSKRVPVYERPPEDNNDFAWWIYSQEAAPQEDVPRDEGHTNYTNDKWDSEIFSNGYRSIIYTVPLNDTKPKMVTKPAVSKTLVTYDRILFVLILLLVVVMLAKYMLW